MARVMFSEGDYAGREIEDIIAFDPAYVVWAYTNMPDLHVSHSQYEQAIRMLDEWNDQGDDGEATAYAVDHGYVSDDD